MSVHLDSSSSHGRAVHAHPRCPAQCPVSKFKALTLLLGSQQLPMLSPVKQPRHLPLPLTGTPLADWGVSTSNGWQSELSSGETDFISSIGISRVTACNVPAVWPGLGPHWSILPTTAPHCHLIGQPGVEVTWGDRGEHRDPAGPAGSSHHQPQHLQTRHVSRTMSRQCHVVLLFTYQHTYAEIKS